MSTPSRRHRQAAAVLYALALSSPYAAAYTFNVANSPTQCGNLSIAISGGGTPPYSVLIIPSGPSPLANNIEARRIVSRNSSGSATTIDFQLDYPANSAFVAVVSDATGFGTGGTSGAAVVQPSSDSSCFDATTNVQPDFFFSIQPTGSLTECEPTRIWWTQGDVQGNPYFYGVIPGGESFAVPASNINVTSNFGQGFSWTPSVRGLTTVILVASDNRGVGVGGSNIYSVNANPQNDNSCLSNNSPSSTPGNPAGGSYPTTTSQASGGGHGGGSDSDSHGSSPNVGAIVGGVVGGIFGVLAIVLIALFFLRRRRHAKRHRREGDPVDLLQQGGDGDGEGETGEVHALPRWYEPEPFLVPPASSNGESSSAAAGAGGGAAGAGAGVGGAEFSAGRPSMERLNSTPGPSASEAGTSMTGMTGMTGMTRKSPVPPTLRPVNVIQHDDAGAAEPAEGEPETVELPPAYTNIRR